MRGLQGRSRAGAGGVLSEPKGSVASADSGADRAPLTAQFEAPRDVMDMRVG